MLCRYIADSLVKDTFKKYSSTDKDINFQKYLEIVFYFKYAKVLSKSIQILFLSTFSNILRILFESIL